MQAWAQQIRRPRSKILRSKDIEAADGGAEAEAATTAVDTDGTGKENHSPQEGSDTASDSEQEGLQQKCLEHPGEPIPENYLFRGVTMHRLTKDVGSQPSLASTRMSLLMEKGPAMTSMHLGHGQMHRFPFLGCCKLHASRRHVSATQSSCLRC